MTSLVRTMRLPAATSLVVGTIIGASIFVQPSEITRAVPSVTGVAAVWALAGVLTLIGALIIAELSSAFPRTGGVYVFLRHLFGTPVAERQWIPYYTERSAWSTRDRARFRESLRRTGPQALADYERMLQAQATAARGPVERVGARVAGIYRPGEEP